MSVRVEVETGRREDVLLAPRAALDLGSDPPRASSKGGRARRPPGACNAHDCVVEEGLAESEPLRLAP